MTIKRIILIVLLLILMLIYNYIQISKFYTNNVKLSSNKLSKSLKITQISDFHSNGYINLNELFKKIGEFEPDLIVITGDLIDKNTEDLGLAIEVLEESKKISTNVYFVSGNHEASNSLSYELYNVLRELDIKHMDFKVKKLTINGNNINIFVLLCYEDDLTCYIIRLVKEIIIYSTHSPNKPINYINENIDFILSGHTHGGQVRLPIIVNFITWEGLLPKYDKGLYKIGNTTLYIDSGLGNSVLPIRMFNRVQISNIEVLPEK